MKKISQILNSPAKMGVFALVIVILAGAIAFGSIQAGAGANANKTIGLDKGVNVALQDAGFKAEDVSGLRAHYDNEDGNAVYEVEFFAGGYEYDYVVKAADGKIIEANREKEAEVIPQQPQVQQPQVQQPEASQPKEEPAPEVKPAEPASKYIGVDKAKSIALKDAGLSSSGVTFTKAKLDKDDGVAVYEVEFFKGNTEYDYEINAQSGKIRDKDIDIENDWDD